ncbi:hypothetical protein [Nodularia chucula]
MLLGLSAFWLKQKSQVIKD